ncbi:MAG: hypothetical protein ISR58_01180 [Anaerolineales bacterium]|nr:hypothetical protein [Chloroflexota bacterium]MBL6979777.1 hypothetical protein [Anaerolineales bacterium]
MNPNETTVNAITRILCGEFFKAIGFNPVGRISRTFSPLVRTPINRFAKIAAGFDQIVEGQNFKEASRWILPNFVKKTEVFGADVIPKEGPLIIAANHPGAYDALVIAANLPRSDIKIVVNIPLPFIREIPSTENHFLYAPPDPHIRIGVIRSALRHLKNGGSLLLFASGGIDPDPVCMPGSEQEIEKWSGSLELFLRRVPQTKLQITIISGILLPEFVHHTFTRFRKERRDKQRISEFFQIMRQMLSPGEFLSSPQLSFVNPLSRDQLLANETIDDIGPEIIRHGQEAFSLHTSIVMG